MKQNELLYIIISIFVVVVIWMGTNFYHAHANSTITETQNIQVAPIAPHFDRSVIDKLKERTVIDPLFEAGTIAASRSATPTPSVSVTPSVSPTATPSARTP